MKNKELKRIKKDLRNVGSKKQALRVLLNALESDDSDVVKFAEKRLIRGVCLCLATQSISVRNDTSTAVRVHIGQTCNKKGSNAFYEIKPGHSERWTRRCVKHKVYISTNVGLSREIRVGVSESFNQYKILFNRIEND